VVAIILLSSEFRAKVKLQVPALRSSSQLSRSGLVSVQLKERVERFSVVYVMEKRVVLLISLDGDQLIGWIFMRWKIE
jgi:hypothetical protein